MFVHMSCSARFVVNSALMESCLNYAALIHLVLWLLVMGPHYTVFYTKENLNSHNPKCICPSYVANTNQFFLVSKMFLNWIEYFSLINRVHRVTIAWFGLWLI